MVLFRPHVFNLTSLKGAHIPPTGSLQPRACGCRAIYHSNERTGNTDPPAGIPPTAKPCLAHVLPPIPASSLQYRRPALEPASCNVTLANAGKSSTLAPADMTDTTTRIRYWHLIKNPSCSPTFPTGNGTISPHYAAAKSGVDVRLIPMLALLYLICHIDRANIGNAKIEGMVEDLGMTGVQYNTVLSICECKNQRLSLGAGKRKFANQSSPVFIPYVLFEVPSNIILKKVKRPSFYLGTLTLCWGIIMTCTGLVRNFGGLMVTRILLGVFEAGFFPGAIYLTSYWYMPKDLAVRISYFYCASALSGAFSGLLAAAIAEMDGVAGLEGWRWIFILEGLATVIMGVCCFFFLIDTPTLSKRWLEPEEIRYLELSIFIKSGGGGREEAGAGGKVNWRDLKMNLTNWRIYVQAYFLVCQSALSYGIKFTLPTITKAMGFANTQAQLLSAPPYVAAAISAITFAKISDRFFWRMPFLAIPLAIVAIAYAIILSLNGALEAKKGVAYFSVVLAVVGIYPIQAAAASWNANNIAPASRRAIGIALMNCVGNVGGIVGSFMYLESEKPKYPTGFGLSLAFGGSGLIVALLLEWSYKSANARKAAIAEEAKTKYTEEELFNLGDRSPLFKYVL
ncbi:major facilitator superfamily transporter [Colletotrichum nymphaeae SA-01]|uniref:Major facilitator superfamily transporter n=1 Tax=Colletotrichum nymphaeae SA-01 TaxID=1460502 RepID=A0A135SE62_9PEZI|nr:major facilitator superfamily transporter [Colletotrichum nymphaeae SA-01]